MNIRFYNCYFGDCFKIANDSGNDLLVDLGIHRFCATKKRRENIFDEILWSEVLYRYLMKLRWVKIFSGGSVLYL